MASKLVEGPGNTVERFDEQHLEGGSIGGAASEWCLPVGDLEDLLNGRGGEESGEDGGGRCGGGQRGAKWARRKGRSESGLFLKGPVPVPWLKRAGSLPGKGTVLLALFIWLQAGLRKRHSGLKVSRKHAWEIFGIEKSAYLRGMKLLEDAKLISVYRRTGRQPIVGICDFVEVKEDPIVGQ